MKRFLMWNFISRLLSSAVGLASFAGAVALLTLPGIADTIAPDALSAHPPHEFLFGADFDPQASASIKALFYETGMNCVRMTGGGFGWSVDMHKKLATDFESRGLKVYMQLGSHYPDASYFDLKEAWMVDQNGRSGVEDRKAWAISYSGQNWPQYSYTSIPFRQKLERDFTSYVNQFKDNHNIAGVILHNEAGFFWLSDRVFDYSPGTLALFHQWLQKQYPAIASLNARWGTNYTSFDEVKPPGLPPVANVAGWMDWRHFSEGTVADFLHWESDFFKSLRPDIPRTTNLDGPLNNWYGYHLANLLDYSANMDRVGMDIYPTVWFPRTFIPYSMDMLQGVAQGRETNVIECDVFSPKLWKDYSEDQRAGLLSSEIWTMIGHGADGILLWGFSRSDNYSLTDGEFNPRLLTCRDIAYTSRMIGLGDFHRPQPNVAICVDPDSYIYATAIGHGLDRTSLLDDENQGYYTALADAGIPSDVILADQIRSGAWKKYKAIIVPTEMMMDADLASQWRSFVSAGGVLIVGASFAETDRWGAPPAKVPAFGLDDVFGLTVTGSLGPGNSAPIQSASGSIGNSEPRENVTLGSAETLARFGDNGPSAVTSNSFQNGKAVYIAARTGGPYIQGWGGGGLSALLADILLKSSLPAPITGPGKSLNSSAILDQNGNMLLVFSDLGGKGKIPAPVPGNHVICTCNDPASYRAAFMFSGTQVEGDRVQTGPVPLPVTATADNTGVALDLPGISATLPVLLAKNAPPLLATEAPVSMIQAQDDQVKVTCFNPATAQMQGRLVLRGDFSGSPKDGGIIHVAPQGQQDVVIHFQFQPGHATGRVTLQAVLHLENPSRDVEGIPVDINVK